MQQYSSKVRLKLHRKRSSIQVLRSCLQRAFILLHWLILLDCVSYICSYVAMIKEICCDFVRTMTTLRGAMKSRNQKASSTFHLSVPHVQLTSVRSCLRRAIVIFPYGLVLNTFEEEILIPTRHILP
jgi:hypothetical protein